MTHYMETIEDLNEYASELENTALTMREELAMLLSDPMKRLDNLYGRMNALADMNAQAEFAAVIAMDYDHAEEDPKEFLKMARRHLRNVIFANPDDTWSGRENDFRRSERDGVMKVAASIDAFLNRFEKNLEN